MIFLKKIDADFLLFIHNSVQNYIFDKTMPFITDLGNLGIIWIIISCLLLLNKKYRYVGTMCICSLLLSSILGEGILKHIFERPRPFVELSNIHLLIPKPSSYSFPSGHSASSFAAAGIIASEIKKFKWPVLTLAVLIAFSRIYLLVHYPSDVLAGIILGIICSRIITKAFERNFPKSADFHSMENNM